VKTRFVDPETRADGAVFLPSRLADNPHIEYNTYNTYAATLAGLPPAERERLLSGDWEIPDDGASPPARSSNSSSPLPNGTAARSRS
jgi:hypothetical protein